MVRRVIGRYGSEQNPRRLDPPPEPPKKTLSERAEQALAELANGIIDGITDEAVRTLLYGSPVSPGVNIMAEDDALTLLDEVEGRESGEANLDTRLINYWIANGGVSAMPNMEEQDTFTVADDISGTMRYVEIPRERLERLRERVRNIEELLRDGRIRFQPRGRSRAFTGIDFEELEQRIASQVGANDLISGDQLASMARRFNESLTRAMGVPSELLSAGPRLTDPSAARSLSFAARMLRPAMPADEPLPGDPPAGRASRDTPANIRSVRQQRRGGRDDIPDPRRRWLGR